MIECEDFLPNYLQRRLIGIFYNKEFPWLYWKNVSGFDINELNKINKIDPNIRENFGFQHLIYHEKLKKAYDKKMYDNLNIPEIIKDAIEKKFNIKVNNIYRIMLGLTTADGSYKDTEYYVPHVDNFSPHSTLIYNINSHNGGTRFFKEKFTDTESLYTTKKTLSHIGISKQGSAILFDGFTYHAGAQPTTGDKMIINVNFT